MKPMSIQLTFYVRLCLILGALLLITGFESYPTSAKAEASTSLSSSPSGRTSVDGKFVSKRVGIQVGHWKIDDAPSELAALHGDWGAVVGGVYEVDINLDIAKRVASLLEDQGITVDLIPATVPPGYQADAFVALHVDSYSDPKREGYQIARADASAIPAIDDALLQAIANEYKKATDMAADPIISDDMTDYYAFNNRRFDHAIAPTTPAVILEMGFMTNPSDLQMLLDSSDVVAGGITRGILRFLNSQAVSTNIEQAEEKQVSSFGLFWATRFVPRAY